MKTVSRNIIAGFILASLTSPLVFADNNTMPVIPKELSSGDFCTNISQLSALKDTMIGKRGEKMQENYKAHMEKRDDRQGKRDDKKTENRGERDGNLTARFESLRKQATTESEKAAVETFIKSATAAETAKRTAMDALVAAERAAIDAKIAEKTGLSSTALNDLKIKMDAAFTKAKTDCANKVSSATVKAEFKKTMEAAHSGFKDIKNDKTIKAEMEKFREAHKADMKKVEDTFKASLESARTELQKAFPNAKMGNTSKKGVGNKIKSFFNTNKTN